MTAAGGASEPIAIARRRVGIALALTLGLAACGAARNSTPSTTGSSPPVPTQAVPTASTVPAAPVVDRTLLAVLPPTVDGIALAASPDAEATAIADPQLKAVGSALAAAIAIDSPSGQFVYAVVVRLVPGAMTSNQFGLWRDSYDNGACSQAGGVDGHVESRIGGRTVFVGACKGGLLTYHVWLQARGILVSASSAGDWRLGELLMGNLRP